MSDLIERLRSKANVEDPHGSVCYDLEQEPPTVTWDEMAEMATLLREAAVALEFAKPAMDLRDYFAAKVMHAELVTAGALPKPAEALATAAAEAGQTIQQRIAFLSYQMADAMLAERSKESRP